MMVNVFIIHSGKDYAFVKEEVEPYLLGRRDELGNECDRGGNANLLTLESGKRGSWKRDALKKIRMAHAVIVILGEDAGSPAKKETMGWEVEQSVKYNKLLMICNRAEYPIPDYLMTVDHFTKQRRLAASVMTLQQIKERIDNYSRGYYNIFSPAYERLDPEDKLIHQNELVDQYKMFQQTSEELVSRRQGVNSFYITVNSALTALVGIVLGIVDAPANILVVMFMCVAGMILDISWINLLDAYGTLNSAKMKVINLLEEQLPVALYDAEWRVMSDKLNNKKYVSFTDSEKRIPKLFVILYAIILIGSLLYLLWQAIL